MPPAYVITIREEICYEYAKLISRSAYGTLKRGFITERFKKLRDGEITISPCLCLSHGWYFPECRDHQDVIGAPGVTRTRGTRIRNPLLYPPELQGQPFVNLQFFQVIVNLIWSCCRIRVE